jgi:hypothetical protein
MKVETTIRLKRLAATCLIAGGVFAGIAVASASAPQPDPPVNDEARPTAPVVGQDEPMSLPLRFSTANVHPSEDDVDTREAVQTLAVGPQSAISDHVTIGGSLTEPDVGIASPPQPPRYVFGLRMTF